MRNQMLILSLVLALVCVPGCGESDPEPDPEMAELVKRLISEGNLREIGQATYSYFMEHDSVPAPSLAILVKEGLLKADNLVSPMSGRGPLKTDENGVPTEPGDYVYIPLPHSNDLSPDGELVIAYERPENYHGSLSGQGTLVLQTHYGVNWMELEDFQEALERTHKWLAEHNKQSSQPSPAVESE